MYFTHSQRFQWGSCALEQFEMWRAYTDTVWVLAWRDRILRADIAEVASALAVLLQFPENPRMSLIIKWWPETGSGMCSRWERLRRERLVRVCVSPRLIQRMY